MRRHAGWNAAPLGKFPVKLAMGCCVKTCWLFAIA
jgi:hypothetical protein